MKTIIRIFYAIVLVFPVLSQAECFTDAAGYPIISGEYVCSAYCPAGGVGNTAYVYQNAANLTFVNEGGMTASGTMSDGVVQVPDWGITATPDGSCELINFSNSTVWSLMWRARCDTGMYWDELAGQCVTEKTLGDSC